ncbi:Arginase family protein [Microbacterium sp. ru370.1]|uniref:arginase family protein n=1 Tax=unclassified Microbacterium TaxID=2609290 RepID=UPI0008886127|nr:MULTISPECIES: arginase family protein [unclassified Microbacterium]SDP01745.1 Arginase family protein [Microbacterium sp. ru370.1]SIT92071.1 Arginase family protein [Microbacterium sp. RU1D]
MSALSVDSLWPRAGDWPLPTEGTDAVLLGVPTWRTSLSPTGAGATPAAVRAALRRYSPTLMGPPPIDLADVLRIADAGDVADPDGRDGEARVRAAVGALAGSRLVIALGGDNSATYAVAQGRGSRGLITLDAHFDLRDGESNGSPVRRLIADGLDPRRIVQIGIADFANSAAYARRAADAGITVITLDEVRRRGIDDVVAHALHVAGKADTPASDEAGAVAGKARPTGTGAHVADAPTHAADASSPAAPTQAESSPHAAAGTNADSHPRAPEAATAPAAVGGVHLDIDVDVCDRAVAPGCPASVPGGLAAWELRGLVRALARDPGVTSADIVEVDATADTDDGRTVRLAALCVLELLAGMAERR